MWLEDYVAAGALGPVGAERDDRPRAVRAGLEPNGGFGEGLVIAVED
ncbi:hypothetical protein [Kribbella speibonae]|nr:hypothetical protein [Kribbella speibonae]